MKSNVLLMFSLLIVNTIVGRLDPREIDRLDRERAADEARARYAADVRRELLQLEQTNIAGIIKDENSHGDVTYIATLNNGDIITGTHIKFVQAGSTLIISSPTFSRLRALYEERNTTR